MIYVCFSFKFSLFQDQFPLHSLVSMVTGSMVLLVFSPAVYIVDWFVSVYV